MQFTVNRFINELRSYKSPQSVFNPWRDYDKDFDICPNAPSIRSKQMEQFLTPRIPKAKYLLVAEAVGYQGGRFTGVALTSERILLGNHKDISPVQILHKMPGTRTSNPNNSNLKETQKRLGFTEPTATIIWGEIFNNKISPLEVITWNIFPFHPYNNSKGPLTNRTPTVPEFKEGGYYTELLLNLCPHIKIISIGKHAARALNKLGIKNFPVPHPANGGAAKFKAAIKDVFAVG